MENCGHNQEKCACPCHHSHHGCSHHEHHGCCCHDVHGCYHGDHNFSDEMKEKYFLGLADEAWQEVLKDKIKEHILKTQSDHMVKLAKIIAEGNSHRWKNRMEKKQGCHDFMEELCEFFGHSKK